MQYKKSIDNKSNKGKKISLIALTSTAVLIICSGAFFGIYSFINNTSFKIINTNVSGIIFGAVVIYLGIRYLMAVFKLKKELNESASGFSWNNFKKQKTA